ncbi:MAG TPA: HAMP domain-containing sensor histidine kinase [Actinomycetota bacterium]|nr:HAMP domain-containing sensor histidine kinase [Actinomycetota bacterium]
MSWARWPLVVAIVAAAATAISLGVLLADPSGDASRSLLTMAAVGFVIVMGAGGIWAVARRRGPLDPLVERAETVGKLAHELRNPIMAIRGLASTGLQLFDRMSDDERREFLQLIEVEATGLQRVTEQAATAMRVDAEALVYDLREEDLGALVEEVSRGTSCGEHPVDVRTQASVSVRADRRHLSEAIANLIDNAAKFSPPDAPIEVSVERDPEGMAIVEVADRGPGIPTDRLEAVFQRFASYRPPGYEETQGAGLGLYLARAHASAHGGRIDVLERQEGGTSIRITLPAGGGG